MILRKPTHFLTTDCGARPSPREAHVAGGVRPPRSHHRSSAPAAVGTARVFLQSLFFQQQGPGSSCCRQEEQGAPRAGRAQHCPPYAAPWPPHSRLCRRPGPRLQEAEPRGRETHQPWAPPPPAPPRPLQGAGLRRPWRGQAGGPRPSACSTHGPFQSAALPVSGLRLQHWNKTQHYITFLFVHLNVYLELHFVRSALSLYSC